MAVLEWNVAVTAAQHKWSFFMQLDLKVIDGYRAVAREIANMLYWAPGFRGDIRPGYHNHFQDNVLNSKLPAHQISGNSLICYCGSQQAQVIFSDIRYSKILNMKVGDPVVFNEHDTDVVVRQWYNDSDEILHEDFTREEKQTVSHSTDILTSLESQLATKIAGGNPATFSAEASAQLTAKFQFQMKDSVEVIEDSTVKEPVIVGAYTHAVYTETHAISDVSENVTVVCLLDAAVSFLSDGDFKRDFDSLGSLNLYMQGGGGGFQEGIDAYFDTRAYAGRQFDLTPLHLTLSEDRISRNTRTFDLRRKDTPIDKE